MSKQGRVIILTTGGTIASLQDQSGRAASGTLPGEALVAALAPSTVARLEVRSILMKPSTDLALDDLQVMHQACAEAGREKDVIGIVLTHGTDTLEDTAFFLQQCVRFDQVPIVVTGAQRPPFEEASDASRNLCNAMTVASSPHACGLGTLVVFNESIFSANNIHKYSSFQLDGFVSPALGRLGYVDGDRVVIQQRPNLPALLTPGATLPRVEVVSAYLGCGPEVLRAVAATGAAGIVIEALGRGNVPGSWLPVIRDLCAQHLPMWVTTHCSGTRSLAPHYSFTGCLADLMEAGVTVVHDLSVRQARLKMSLLLSGNKHDP